MSKRTVEKIISSEVNGPSHESAAVKMVASVIVAVMGGALLVLFVATVWQAG